MFNWYMKNRFKKKASTLPEPDPFPATTSRWAGSEIPTRIFSSPPHQALNDWATIHKNTNILAEKLTPGFSDHNNSVAADQMVLIHAIRSVYYNNSSIGACNIEWLMSTWDTISTSLIKLNPSDGKCYNQFDDVAIIVSAPPQNIISTMPRDVWFPGHAGVDYHNNIVHPWELTQAYFHGRHLTLPNADFMNELDEIIQGTYSRIMTPEELIKTTYPNKHNEVLVVGKENINTYANGRERLYSFTQNLKVCGIYYRASPDSTAEDIDRHCSYIERLQAHNEGIPIVLA